MNIIKRDGRLESFNCEKIQTAVSKACYKVGKSEYETKLISRKITDLVSTQILYSSKDNYVDDIHNLVEKFLVEENYYDVAKEYILYRQQRTNIRDSKSDLTKAIKEISSEMHKDNANTNNSAASKMYGIAEAANKPYVLNYDMPEKFAQNHKDGKVYINDLGYYNHTFNCFFNPIGKMLKDGFENGVGTIRPPKRIGSAMALVAIILQSSQNSMFGGQGIVNFDTDLAHYVELEYNYWLKEIRYILKDVDDNFLKTGVEELAMQYTEKSTYQACEAFVYNMNTMRSRSGAQVTFSSINFGTDTSEYARMISSGVLKAYMAGLGKGENPIFPNLCFRLKSGVNLEPDTPNYDLYKLAIQCVGKRIQPRFVFADSPAYSDWKYSATMGCVDGDEVISYMYKDKFYCESFKRLWNRIEESVQIEKLSEYKLSKDVKIWDGENGFVNVKTIIKNPDKGDWTRLTFSNGRSILVTADHPLYTENRGRIYTNELEIGDTVKAYYDFPINGSESTTPFLDPYLLGVLIADGCYSNGSVTATFDTKTEQDIISSFCFLSCMLLGKEPTVRKLERGKKGSYTEINMHGGKELCDKLYECFGGYNKSDRSIPNFIFTGDESIRLDFMAGLIDADGHVSSKSKVQLGSTNKELALQQLALAQSLGLPAKMYLNRYNGADKSKLRYRIEFSMTKELAEYMESKKKIEKQWNGKESKTEVVDVVDVTKIEFLGSLDKCSYDVETDTDSFTVSFIKSANCRTAVRSNINGSQDPDARGNLAFNNINLPYLALECKEKYDYDVVNMFFDELSTTIDEAIEQLAERYKVICSLKVKDIPFVSDWYQGHEGLDPNDSIEPMVKNGSLSVGFIGLAECLTALIGKHHGESKEAQELGLRIVKLIRSKTDQAIEKYHMNYSTFATPAESACYSLLKALRKRFGIVEGVSDKEFLTNSSHVPVDYKCDIKHKIDIEAPYHLLCNAGHIGYIELGATPKFNLEGAEDIINYMAKSGMVYGGVNFVQNFCNDCNKDGTFENDICPYCGSTNVKRTAIITGYLSTEDRFNPGKVAELNARVSHGGGSFDEISRG